MTRHNCGTEHLQHNNNAACLRCSAEAAFAPHQQEIKPLDGEHSAFIVDS